MHWEVHKTIQAKNSEEINTRELYIATKIFRDFNGKRENGVLMVDDPEKGKRVKITYDWFVKYLKNMAGLEEGIHRFMQKNCQNLLDRGLLVYRDFEVQTTREAGRIIRKEWKPVEGKKFEVSQNYTKYYIAQKGYFIQDERKIPTQNIKVVLLDNKTLGVVSKVNNAEKLEYTIDMLNSEEMKEKKYVNSEERNNRIDKFSLSSVIMKKAGESEEEYLDRASKVSEYNHVKDVSENLLNECQVSIHNLSWREQVWLSVAEHELRLQNKYDEFLDFVREYKLEGLRTFLSCEQDLDNAQELINFSKKENPEIVEKIIKSYAQIQEKARLLEEAMHSQEYLENKNASQAVKEKLRNNLYDAFISRATDILNTAFVISEKGEAKANFYNGKEISMSKLDEVHEALSVYEDFLEKLRGFFREDGQYKFTHQETIDKDEMKIYQFSVVDNSADEKSYCSVSIRPEGNNDFLEDYEYDGEARINFLFNPENISANINDKSRREATTFRLDRECMIFNKKGELIGKDFAQKNGKVSLDFGSIYEDAGRENSVLGRAMSLGNFYNSQKKNKNPEYYHNKEAFYTELGEADAFRQIAKLVEEYIKKKYLENE